MCNKLQQMLKQTAKRREEETKGETPTIVPESNALVRVQVKTPTIKVLKTIYPKTDTMWYANIEMKMSDMPKNSCCTASRHKSGEKKNHLPKRLS